MSYNASDKSGEVTVLDPLDFLQFAGIGGLAKGVSGIASAALRNFVGGADKTLVKTIQSSSKEIAKINPSIFDKISSLLSKPATKIAAGGGAATIAATTIPKQVTQVVTKNGISVVDKALVSAGIIGATTLGTVGILSLTPGGQNVVNTAGDTAKGFTDFIKQNQTGLIVIGGLIGAALLIGAFKK